MRAEWTLQPEVRQSGTPGRRCLAAGHIGHHLTSAYRFYRASAGRDHGTEVHSPQFASPGIRCGCTTLHTSERDAAATGSAASSNTTHEPECRPVVHRVAGDGRDC